MSHRASDDHKYATAKTPMQNAILYYANQKNLFNATSDDANPNDKDVDNDSGSEFSKMYKK